jgi:hypothetical protein
MVPYKETHQQGLISIENMGAITKRIVPSVPIYVEGDLGIQIAKDGRVWVCIDGVAFLRFTPNVVGKEVQK